MTAALRAGASRPGARPEARRAAALALALALLAVVYSLALPIFEGPDEIWHFAFANHLADGGGLPVLSADDPAILLRNAAHPPLYYLPIAALIAPIDRTDFPSAFRFNLASPRITPGSTSDGRNLLIHTRHEDFPYRQTTLAVHLGRLVSALLGGLTVFCVWATARRLVPNLALWAAVLAAGVPQFAFGAGVVNNDALAAAAVAGTLLALVGLMQAQAARWALAAGLCLGAALLSKIGMVALLPLPALAVGLMWLAARRTPESSHAPRAGRLLGHLALTYGVAALVAGWWYARNWRLYGDPLAWREWQALAGVGRPAPSPAEFVADMVGLFGTFWADFGLRVDRQWSWVFAIVVLIAGLGWVRRVARREWPNVYWPGLALATAAFGLLLASAVRYALVITEIHGRLLHPAQATVGVGLALGLSGWGPRLGRWMLLAAAVLLWAVSTLVPLALLGPTFARPVLAGALPASVMPAGVDFGGYVRVVGVAPLPQEAQPGETIVVRTYWRSIATANGSVGSAVPDLWVIVALQQPDGTVVGRAEARLGTTLYPSSVWQPDDIVLSDVPIQLAGELSRPALAAAWLGVRAETADLLATGSGGDSFGLGQVAIRPDAPCSPQVPTQVDFGGQIRLQGYRLESGGLTLCWTALRAPAADYTVFVHILDAAGTQVGGADGPPVGGQYPTSAWTPGETVTDWRALEWPPGAAVEIGLYVLASGERLVIDGTAETGFRLPR